ncbi:MAG: MraY family glycosyltransferase [Anaerolineae bacterium]
MLAGVRVDLFQSPLDWLISLVWIVGIINATNFLDNMDGLATGVSAIAAFFMFILSVSQDGEMVSSLSAALCGAAIGFLLYNFNPATTFMGDLGSHVLGFLLAVCAIKLRFPTQPLSVSWMIPLLVLGCRSSTPLSHYHATARGTLSGASGQGSHLASAGVHRTKDQASGVRLLSGVHSVRRGGAIGQPCQRRGCLPDRRGGSGAGVACLYLAGTGARKAAKGAILSSNGNLSGHRGRRVHRDRIWSMNWCGAANKSA